MAPGLGAPGQSGHTPDSISTDAGVSFEQQGEGWAITGIELTTGGPVPGMDEDAFRQAAETAKETCPVPGAQATRSRRTRRSSSREPQVPGP